MGTMITKRNTPRKRKVSVYKTNYSAGGILASTASGASMGSAAGPWGTLGGAIVGLGVGIYNNNKEKEAEREQELYNANQQKLDDLAKERQVDIRNNAILKDYNSQINNSLYYSMGGKMKQLYPMGGRGIMPVNSTDAIAKGPSHAQGGVDIGGGAEVEGGENVRQNPQTGETEIDSARLGTAQANQPLMIEKAKIEQVLNELKSKQAKLFLNQSKETSFRAGNEISRKMQEITTQVSQLEEQLAGIQQAIEANFQQQQAINGDSQGQPAGNPNNPNPGTPMMDGSGQGRGMGMQMMGAQGIQAPYGARIKTNPDGNIDITKYINPNDNVAVASTTRVKQPIGLTRLDEDYLLTKVKLDNAKDKYNELSNKAKNSEDVYRKFITTNKDKLPKEYRKDVYKKFWNGGIDKDNTFGQGKGVMGNATLGVDSDIYKNNYQWGINGTTGLQEFKDISGNNTFTPVGTDNTFANNNQTSTQNNGGLKIGATGWSAIGQGATGLGTYLANKSYIKKLKDMPIDYLDRKTPLLYSTNRTNVEESLLQRQLTEARRLYQNNPTPANQARYNQLMIAGADQMAKLRQQRENEGTQVANANRQEVNNTFGVNTGIDKYNSMLDYNKRKGVLDAEVANTQGLINSGANVWNTSVTGINNNKILNEKLKQNPNAILSTSFNPVDYRGIDGKSNIMATLSAFNTATPGTARDKKLKEFQVAANLNDAELQTLITEMGLRL